MRISDWSSDVCSSDLGVDVALDHLTGLLDRAREAGTPVVHVRHKGQPGSLFDLDQARGAIHPAVAPREGELVIAKGLPNAFAGTAPHEELDKLGRRDLIVPGFSTHMCVSTDRKSVVSGMSVSVRYVIVGASNL